MSLRTISSYRQYNGLRVDSRDCKERIRPDERVTFEITENCRQLGLEKTLEIDAWVKTETLDNDQNNRGKYRRRRLKTDKIQTRSIVLLFERNYQRFVTSQSS